MSTKEKQSQLRSDSQTSCDCVHPNALTCIAERNHTTRFNASIIFAKFTEMDGKCACLCHVGKRGKQVSQMAWEYRMRRMGIGA